MAVDYANSEIIGYNPTPGPKNPSKYPFTGQAYNHFGEQSGYVYDPYSDSYKPDPKVQQGYYEASGLAQPEPKKPGMLESVAPIAAAGGALALGTGFGRDPGAFISGITDTVGGWFGSGGGSPVQAAQASQATAPVAQAAAQTGGSAFSGIADMLGFGGSGAGTEISTTPLGGSSLPTLGLEGASVAAPGPFSLGGFGAAGNAYLPALGALGAYQTIAKPNDNPALGALQGAASGAAMGSYFGPPGAIVGGAVGGLVGLGSSIFGKDKDRWKTESNKLQNLQEDGVYVPENLLASMPTKGRKLEDLIDKSLPKDFVGRDANGNWVNNKFASSRNVRDLQPEDIVNYSAFAEQDPQWFTKPLDERLGIAKQALDAGAVKEGRGSITVDFKKLQAPQAAPSPTTAPQAPKPVMKDPPRPSAQVAPPAPAQTVKTTPPVRDGFGIRQSPGVYKDPKTGQTFNSVNGKLPGRR